MIKLDKNKLEINISGILNFQKDIFPLYKEIQEDLGFDNNKIAEYKLEDSDKIEILEKLIKRFKFKKRKLGLKDELSIYDQDLIEDVIFAWFKNKF